VKDQSTVVKVSSESVSQLGALGFVLNENSDEMMLQSIEEMEWEIKQLYGGLAAERVVFGQSGSTTGSANDIQKATKLLKHLMLENSVYSEAKLDHSELAVSEKLLKSMEKKSSFFYNESYKIIEEHKDLLCHLSQKLMEEWSLDKERLFEIIYTYCQTKTELEEEREHGFGILKEKSA
jgi:cell division protease FtsH